MPATPAPSQSAIHVSCVMVTRGVPDRFAYLQRSVAAYTVQTHPLRDLVILIHGGTDEYRAEIAAHVDSLGRDDIRVLAADEAVRMGGLRRMSRDAARGAVHCQWDDDDFHHPERIERQLAALLASGMQAVLFQHLLQYFPAERVLYCVNWRATEATGHPGTLMCTANAPMRYPESGYEAQFGEDLSVALQLKKQGVLHLLADAPQYYVYVSHGANLWSEEHHRMWANRLAMSAGMVSRREAQIREGLRVFDFGPGPIRVMGSNGPAFTIETPSAG